MSLPRTTEQTSPPATRPALDPHARPAERRTRLGAYGEQVAARHLSRWAGMVVLDRNWRCDAGEIDLVLRDGDVLVICEVKTRSSTRFGHPVEAVTPAKAERLRTLAARWCEARGVRPHDIRVDLVGVLVDGTSVTKVDHIRAVGG
jgi:putative endonuclease